MDEKEYDFQKIKLETINTDEYKRAEKSPFIIIWSYDTIELFDWINSMKECMAYKGYKKHVVHDYKTEAIGNEIKYSIELQYYK